MAQQAVDIAHIWGQLDGLGEIISRILATNSRQISHPDAFASLLKSIEPPPENNVFVAPYDVAQARLFGDAQRDQPPQGEGPNQDEQEEDQA